MQPAQRKFQCPLCGWTGHPTFELVDAIIGGVKTGKLAAKCGKEGCTFISPNETAADFNVGLVSDKETKETRVVSTQRNAVPAISDQVLRDIRPMTVNLPRTATPPTGDPIEMLRAKRAVLERDIARGLAAKAELRTVAKMLAVYEREQARAEIAREVDAALVAPEPN
jgi:hypothetical protein